ncbi:MAG: oligosaccharyl transferase, archaeosortase A system-associated [Chloroflexi bacterium]|nr:oligosaccharyl transferase, archaeosortase A system-associated [Chloroflexota bacterium]
MLTGAVLLVLAGMSLFLRVFFSFDQVIAEEWVKFSGVDAYWHMRIIDNLVRNFPNLIHFDPYNIFPGGEFLDKIHFFDWFLAGLIKLLTLGAPSERAIDLISAYFPAALGALTVIPVYFLGKHFSSRWGGLIAAALIAVMPGEFLGRSLLGFTDHHIAEALLSATAMLFLALALKKSPGQLTFRRLQARELRPVLGPLLYAVLAGVMLGIYIITWQGALLFLFIIFVFFLVQFLSDLYRDRPSDYLSITGVLMFLAAGLIAAPFSAALQNLLIFAAALVLGAATVITRFITARRLKPRLFPLSLGAMGAVSLAVFYLVDPDRLIFVLRMFTIFVPTSTSAATTLEMQGLFFPGGAFSTAIAWGNFNTGLIVFPLALVLLGYRFIKQGQPGPGLMIVWSLVILAATLGQRRFAYYLAVNVAVLAGYVSWEVIRLLALRRSPGPPPVGRRRQAAPKPGSAANPVLLSLSLLLVLGVVFAPNVPQAIDEARREHFGPPDAWQKALLWMRDNTPEPFPDAEFYYRLNNTPDQGFSYPDTAYGVSAWWDYGYWITRIARRIPSANPSQSPRPIKKVAALFLSQDETAAAAMMQTLGSAYVVLDYKPSSTIFWAILMWGEKPEREFYDYFYTQQGNSYIPERLYFYPAYYRTLAARLYNFDGRAVTSQQPVVVSYEDRVSAAGVPFKKFISEQAFSSYYEAQSYIDRQPAGSYRIVGNNPYISPVALPQLDRFKLVYSSEETVSQASFTVPEVKIFAFD